MGAVRRAIDRDIHREVAIKYLLDQEDEGKKARFVEEAQVTGQLEHPNIVPVHELGVDAEGRLYFTMKLVRGRSLRAVLDELRENPEGTTWTLGRLLNVLVNICHALAYAHARGVVHRDLKPANIMIGDFGEVYVMDWGLAKLLPSPAHPRQRPSPDDPASDSSRSGVVTDRTPDIALTMEGSVVGTPVYMSPEQAAGGQIDQRSDIYGLGAILYELLTLCPPISREGDYVAVLRRVVRGEIEPPERCPRLHARQAPIAGELSAIAMKALALRPDDRYQTAEALRRDIELHLEGRAVSAKEDTFWEMFVKLVRRNRGVSLATGVALGVLSMVLAASWWINYDARRRAETSYAAYLEEQEDKRRQGRESVPAFVRAARLSIDHRRFDDALAQANVAVDFDPDHAEARLLRGQLLIVRGDYSEAQDELEVFLQLEPGHQGARRLAELCQDVQPDDDERLMAFAQAFTDQTAFALADAMTPGFGPNTPEGQKRLLALYRKRLELAWPGYQKNLSIDAGGEFALFLGDNPLSDLGPLRGLPLGVLSLSRCPQLRDLSPLEGMKLRSLDLSHCVLVQDLAPLRGMPLTQLTLNACSQVKDLTPLAGMPLTRLYLFDCKLVADLTPLKQAKLEILDLMQCVQVRDLAPLEGMPLGYLRLVGCESLSDLSALRGMPLTSLDLAGCTRIADLTPLRGMPLKTLTLASCPVADLSPLRGMKLTTLNLNLCRQLRNLTALENMPLERLYVGGCTMDSLAPLRGMKLAHLSLTGCEQVRDLTPLEGMPLKGLELEACSVTDITPLKDLPLELLGFTPQQITRGLEVLRGMPTLKTIRPNGVEMPAQAFWKRYDAGEFKQ